MEDWGDLATLALAAGFVVMILAIRHWFWR
jgi:hypothetical protein